MNIKSYSNLNIFEKKTNYELDLNINNKIKVGSFQENNCKKFETFQLL
jgi:hypothetical protein